MPKTADDILALLERSNLLSPEEFAEARDLSADYSDATQFAKALARNGFISFWQAGHLLQGRSTFLLGKYRLIELLGRGGMGSVFLASHVVMHRKVALKFIPERIAKNPDALGRFLAEARTIAALDHSNIVRAYSVDNEGNRYYLVMEYVDGMDLQRAVEAYGPLEFEAAVDYIRQAADGLAHAHARNMIHCDIKPSNLIVTEEEGIVKILDMGLARLVQDKPAEAGSNSSENHVLGTVDYLAPEQAIASSDFDHRADIYSLGCTFYFLLTGHAPFPTGTLAQRIVKHQTLEPVEIAHERPEIQGTLVSIIKKMMAKNPADRYQTAGEVSEVLAAWQPEVPQPVKKTIAIKKVEPIQDISKTSPWEQEFGDELKNLAAGSGSYDFGLAPGSSGKMQTKSGTSDLMDLFAGTPTRRVLTSCFAAVVLVFFASAILYSVYFKGDARGKSGNSPTGAGQLDDSKIPDNPPPPPTVSSDTPPQQTATPKDNPPTPAPDLPPVSATPSVQPTPPVPPENSSTNPPPEVPSVQQNVPLPENAEPPPPAEPLKDLASSVELPPVGGDDSLSFMPASLGKVQVDAKAKLQIELIGGERSLKGFGKYSLQDDPNSIGGQAWNISRMDSKGKATPVARLKLKDSELTFDWIQSVSPSLANPVRNCGAAITVGESNRFVQFRVPKSAEPLLMDFEKPQSSVRLHGDNLPEADKIKMVIQELKEPLPKFTVNPETALSLTKRRIQIDFADCPAFSIVLNYDVVRKADAINVDMAYYLRGRMFKLSMGDSLLKDLKADLNKKERQQNSAKNADAKASFAPIVDAAKTDLKQAIDGIELVKKLNGQSIHYQFILDYEKYQLVLFDSQIPPPNESTDAEKAAAPSRVSGK